MDGPLLMARCLWPAATGTLRIWTADARKPTCGSWPRPNCAARPRPVPGSLGHSGRLSLVAQALIAVGAVDVGTADEIQAELDLALAVRQSGEGGAAPQRLSWFRPRRDVTGTFGGSRPASWRVAPVGQVIRIRDDEIRGDLGLLAYLQTAHGGRFTMAGWMHRAAPGPGTQSSRPRLHVSRHFVAADDKGAGLHPAASAPGSPGGRRRPDCDGPPGYHRPRHHHATRRRPAGPVARAC